MTRIYDTFMFNDELDILECRLTELENCDVTHVLVEATIDHQGHEKPLVYADNKSRFGRWNDRIIHVIVDDLHGDSDWDREQNQRDYARRGLADADPEDLIINSDCDEILSENAISAALALREKGFRLVLRSFRYACDWEIIGGEVWDKPVVARWKDIGKFNDFRRSDNGYERIHADMFGPLGWHFTSFGGPDAILAKLRTDCHGEIRDRIREFVEAGKCYEKGEFPFDVGHADPVDVDDTWPRYVREGRCPAVWFRPREEQ